jgi:hypothetical protein
MKLTLAPLSLLICTSCLGSGSTLEPLPNGGIHVLFIGNSLTYTNDLPGTVAALAASVGDTVHVRSVANPNFAVIDHAYGGSSAAQTIKGSRWEYVILQQGPTPAGLDRDTLILAAKLFDPIIRAAGGRTAAVMTWPSASQRVQFPRLFDQTRDTCQLEAQAVNGVCMAAGEAWRAAWAENASIALYGPDSYHPSPLGTYLMALVVYEHVTGHDARRLPAIARLSGGTLSESETTVRMLQRVAHETVMKFISP